MRHLLIALSVLLFVAATVADATDSTPASTLKVIVVDPGHGGEDTGAIGPNGTTEKSITLQIALRLKDAIEDRLPYVNVVLTRTDDTYISLKERTAIANRVRADLFLSIHANAAYRRGASGVETFFLSLEASDNDARMLAAIENNMVPIESEDGMDGKKEVDELTSILWDLTQTETHHESQLLAEFVHTSLVEAVKEENRGVKQAPFIVLAGATMPAVLVEVGFISNPAEEIRLSDPDYQQKIAHAIAKGIAEFEKEIARIAYEN